MRKLSKSACEKYMQCPASFDYHYNQKIRPIKVGSPLVFGSAVDNALNAILLRTGSWVAEFQKAFNEVPLGDMVPHHSDFDWDLVEEIDKPQILEAIKAEGYKGDDVNDVSTKLIRKYVNGESLSENQNKVVDLIARFCLKAKADLFFQAYVRDVLPNIEKVYNVQKESGPGYLDATVEWKGIGKVIIDHKTSGKRYPDNAVEYSAQLAMYAAEEKINLVAYVVFLKAIRKNRIRTCSTCGVVSNNNRIKTCDATANAKDDGIYTRCDGQFDETIRPEAEIQVVHGEITEQGMAVAEELQREVKRAVDAKIFPCNVQQCNSQFGKPCTYRDLKWKGDMTGLKQFTREELKKK